MMGFGEGTPNWLRKLSCLGYLQKENRKADLIQILFHLKVLFIYVYTETVAIFPRGFRTNEARADFEVGWNFDEAEFIVGLSCAFQEKLRNNY